MISKLLLHEAIGETRAIALDAIGRPVASFFDRWADADTRLRWGTVSDGIIRKLSKADGGAFIGLDAGGEGFFPVRDMGGLVEGARGKWMVAAEARRDKLAKLAEATPIDVKAATPIERWQASLPGADALEFDTSPEAARRIEEAFDDALSPNPVLPGGGRLQITPTPALVAVDVDTAGRSEKGRASERARAVNLAAVEELARQAGLRNLGGALVVDCIGPIARRDSPDIKVRFDETFARVNQRRAESLKPSRFGLMEIVLERRWQPLHEAYFDKKGALLPLAVLLWALRDVERAATANRADRLALHLPAAGFSAFKLHRNDYDKALKERYGSRIEVVETSRDKPDVVIL